MTLVDRNGDVVPVRWSWLSRFAQSAAHARHAALYGKDPTPAMKLGTATHAAVFEPHRLVEYTGKVRRGKEWEAFQAAQAPDPHAEGAGGDFAPGQQLDPFDSTARAWAWSWRMASIWRRICVWMRRG